MSRSRVATTAIALLIGIGLLLSACAEGADYRGAYGYPAYSSFYGGGWKAGTVVGIMAALMATASLVTRGMRALRATKAMAAGATVP